MEFFLSVLLVIVWKSQFEGEEYIEYKIQKKGLQWHNNPLESNFINDESSRCQKDSDFI